jgi:GNAT superfamily N-acetyltransferase
VLVAEDGGRAVGFANANLRRQLHHAAPVCTLDELVVADGRRSAGVGARLVAELERTAGERGADSFELTCNLRREDAHRFYERLGFERTSWKFAKRPS